VSPMPFFRPRPRRLAGPPEAGPRRRVLSSIDRNVLDSALACAASAYPNEFGGILRSDRPGIITDLILLPGTTAGRRHANFQLYMLPVDLTVVGTVHSHPSGALHPSEADLTLFRRWGKRHLILGFPFQSRHWRAYDSRGEPVNLDVVGGPSPRPPYQPRPYEGRSPPEVAPRPDEEVPDEP
jgi:proteasome lid subunit RPN8/RPN11